MKETLQEIYKAQDKIPQLIEVLADPNKKQLIKDYYVKLNILLSGTNNDGKLVSSESIVGGFVA